MNPIPVKDVVIRFSLPVRISVLLATAAALFAFVPLALDAVPNEALGPMAAFLAVPGFFAYLSIIIFTYRIQITPDRILTEAFPNPFIRSGECLLAEISGIEKDRWWSTLSIFRYRKPESYRITNMETREAGPIEFLDAIQARIGRNIFLERTTSSLRRNWKWHTLLINSILLLGSAWLSLQILGIGGAPDIPAEVRGIILNALFLASILLAIADWFIYRSLNRDD